jgi:hypothetical protein
MGSSVPMMKQTAAAAASDGFLAAAYVWHFEEEDEYYWLVSGTSRGEQQHEPLNVESDHVKVRQTRAAFDPRIWNTNPTN